MSKTRITGKDCERIELEYTTINIDCNDCSGDGYHEEGPECSQPASNCCGGCYKEVQCKQCAGTGKLELMFTQEELVEVLENISQKYYDDAFSIVFKTITES